MLPDSGFKNDVEYVGSRVARDHVMKRNRVRRIAWFNPPYSKNVIIRVGHKFLKLIDKKFPIGSRLHKVFNRNTVKVSYSCTPNMGTIIKRHNARTCGAGRAGGGQPRRCNCRRPEQCPLNGRCFTSRIVYKATVETSSTRAPKVYRFDGNTTLTPIREPFDEF